MTVKELIVLLQKLPQFKIVYLEDCENGPLKIGSVEEEHEQIDKNAVIIMRE